MAGRLSLCEGGRLHGWLPAGPPDEDTVVQVQVDGEPVSEFRALPGASPKADRAPAGVLRFSVQLPPACLDGRVRQVRAHRRGGGELAGSPLVVEGRREGAPGHAFRLQPDSAACGDGFIAAGPDAAVSFAAGPPDAFAAAPGALAQHGLDRHEGYRTWPAYVARFRDHYVDAGYGGVYRPDGGAVWQGSTYLFNTWAEQRACLQVLAGALAPAPAPRCILFCNSVRDTYFHWHLDGLAGLLAARERLGPEPVAIGPPLNRWQRQSLELLGETVAELDAVCRPPETFVASHIDGRGIRPDAGVLRLFRRLGTAHRARPWPDPPGGLGPRVFISRRDAAHRVLANEDELWGALEGQGFRRFTPGEADYREQIEVFARAEVVVASHGSAQTNMGFCRPGAQVVEILPADYVNGCFRNLAIACGLRHAWYATDQVDPFAVEVAPFMDWCAAQELW